MRERKWARRRTEKKERWGERAFYGNGADSGLSQLGALESLFVHNHFGITWICPPPSFLAHTNTSAGIHRQKHICSHTGLASAGTYEIFQGANWNYHLEASGYCQPVKLEFKSVLVQTHMACGLKTWIGGPQKLVSLFQHLIKCKMCSQSKSSAPQLWHWIMAKVLLSGNFEVTVTFSQFILESKWMLMSDIRSQQPREALEIIKTIFTVLYMLFYPSIFFLVEPIPAVMWWEEGCTLDTMPVCHRVNI